MIVHFTVTGGNEAVFDRVLIQPFFLYYIYHVVLMLTSYFKRDFNTKDGNKVTKGTREVPELIPISLA